MMLRPSPCIEATLEPAYAGGAAVPPPDAKSLYDGFRDALDNAREYLFFSKSGEHRKAQAEQRAARAAAKEQRQKEMRYRHHGDSKYAKKQKDGSRVRFWERNPYAIPQPDTPPADDGSSS